MQRTKIISNDGIYWAEPVLGNPIKSNGDTTSLFMYRILDENENVVACVTFTWSRTARVTCSNLFFRSDPEEELTYLGLLPYLPQFIEKAKDLYSACFKYTFCSGTEGINSTQTEYSLNVQGGFMRLMQRFIFAGKPTDNQIRMQILKVLHSHWLEDTQTKVPFSHINIFVPVDPQALKRNALFLYNEDQIDVLSTDQEPLISAQIKNDGIKYVEDTSEFSIKVTPEYFYRTLTVNQIYAHTSGNNSPIIMDSNNVSIAFNKIENEIKDSEFENKTEVLKLMKDLSQELDNTKDPEKVKGILSDIKRKAEWVNEKIISHPLIAQILAQIFAKQLGLL